MGVTFNSLKKIQHLFFVIEKYYLLKYQPIYFWETRKDATKFVSFSSILLYSPNVARVYGLQN